MSIGSSFKATQDEITEELTSISSKTDDEYQTNENINTDLAMPKEDDQQNVAKKLPIDQFVATALGNGTIGAEAAIKDFSMLQSTLFTLQNQQIFQMKLIERLKSQLFTKSSKNDKTVEGTLKESGDDIKKATRENDKQKSKSNNKESKDCKLG